MWYVWLFLCTHDRKELYQDHLKISSARCSGRGYVFMKAPVREGRMHLTYKSVISIEFCHLARLCFHFVVKEAGPLSAICSGASQGYLWLHVVGTVFLLLLLYSSMFSSSPLVLLLLLLLFHLLCVLLLLFLVLSLPEGCSLPLFLYQRKTGELASKWFGLWSVLQTT